jgi:hypothetical protein
MSKTIETFLEKVAWPLLFAAILPMFTLFGSKLQSGDWLTWLKRVPSWGYIAFSGLTLGWLALAPVVRRFHHLRERNLPASPGFFTIPHWGYVTVGTLAHKNVIWRVQIPAPPPWETLTLAEARSARVDVETPPRCPKCDTALEETETFFGNFRWSCLRCGFFTKNNMSYYREALRAEKLAESCWEKGGLPQS